MKSMDIHQVIKRLPHRYPFLLVDRVLELEDGKRIKALKNVTINEPFFVGHFPNRPVMPGVLMLEALAQTSALLSMIPEGEELAPDVLYYFVGIDNARFKRPVEPGDQLIMEATMERAREFRGVAGAKPRTAARFQALSIAEPRYLKNVRASVDRSALRCVSRAAAGALV